MIVYHYTDLKSGISILQDGFIEVPETIDNNIKSAIWFTKQSKYIPSTLNDNKSFDEKIKTVGCMRFVFNNEGELPTWKNFINNLKLQKRDYLEIMMNLDKLTGTEPGEIYLIDNTEPVDIQVWSKGLGSKICVPENHLKTIDKSFANTPGCGCYRYPWTSKDFPEPGGPKNITILYFVISFQFI